jgi:TrmH family RNA methyltransferase
MNIITSTSNNLIKHIIKIREDKTYRNKYNLLLITNKKIITEVSRVTKPLIIFSTEDTNNFQAAEHYELAVHVMKKLTGLVSPESSAAVFSIPKACPLDNKKRVLITENIADPGNLGALMRSAVALGFDGLFLLGNNVDPFHERVLRASRGALFYLSYEYGCWDRLHELTKNKRSSCVVADIKGKSLHTIAPYDELFLLLSNEAHGLSQEAQAFGTKVCIPMKGPMESLNVSIAGALLMYGLSSKN